MLGSLQFKNRQKLIYHAKQTIGPYRNQTKKRIVQGKMQAVYSLESRGIRHNSKNPELYLNIGPLSNRLQLSRYASYLKFHC